ncbi:NAD-dependent epimerase [Bacteroidales bacterium OttesenSCG-928-M11]|nr:NAD-dependent epimerase [Bacteroidales bacterium OttesenSCG-928-M11]
MKVLVTGAAGFIGFSLVRFLQECGVDSIVGLDNINDYYNPQLKYDRLKETGILKDSIQYGHFSQSNRYTNYRFVKLNLEDRSAIEQLFKDEQFDYVCHLAAQAGVRYSLENPHAYIDSNIVGFINILEACRQNPVRHLVFASSSSVYGMNVKVPFSEEDRVDNPVSLYAATKKANELMAYTYSHLYNIPTSGLRFFTVYGPWGRPDMAPVLFTKAIVEDKPLQVFNNGQMMRDFTYIDDIVEGIYRVINTAPKETPAYKLYNIGCSKPVKLLDFIKSLESALGKDAVLEMKAMQKGDVTQTYADTTRLEKEVGYKPQVQLEQGISRFVDWYKSYYKL